MLSIEESGMLCFVRNVGVSCGVSIPIPIWVMVSTTNNVLGWSFMMYAMYRPTTRNTILPVLTNSKIEEKATRRTFTGIVFDQEG